MNIILINNYASYAVELEIPAGQVSSKHELFKLKTMDKKIVDVLIEDQYYFISKQITIVSLNNNNVLKSKILYDKLAKIIDIRNLTKKELKSTSIIIKLVREYLSSENMDIEILKDYILELIKLSPTNSYLVRIYNMLDGKNKDKFFNKEYLVEITDAQEFMVYVLHKKQKILPHPCDIILNENGELRIIKKKVINEITNIKSFFDVDSKVILESMVLYLS